MKKILILFVLFCLSLTSCGAEQLFKIKPLSQQTSTPTQTNTPAPTATPTLGGGSTRVSKKDGMVILYIPDGEFNMGNAKASLYESPVHKVYLDAFWMDQTEVTNSMFAKFLNDMGNQVEGDVEWWDENISNADIKLNNGLWMPESGLEDYPVVGVRWHGADSYCEWAGRRLPTEAEWEKAARGGLDGKIYPWGDQGPVCSVGPTNGAQFSSCQRGMVPVKTYLPNGYGVYDTAGNVWEWVADWYDSIYYGKSLDKNPPGPTSGIQKSRVLRGGSWMDSSESLRVSYRFYYYFGYTNDTFGFRCAISQ